MPRIVHLLVPLLAAALLAACSGGNGASSSSGSATGAASTEPPSTATAMAIAAASLTPVPDLTPLLITDADVSRGWMRTASTLPDSDDEVGFCGSGRAPVTRLARVETEYQDTSTGRTVNESIDAYAPGDGQRVIDFFAKSLAECAEWRQVSDQGDDIIYRLQPLQLPVLGDGQVAARMTIEQPGAPRQVDLVVIRRGDVVVYLAQIASGGASVDPLVTQQLARRAGERLAMHG